jgi:hypothetical protein
MTSIEFKCDGLEHEALEVDEAVRERIKEIIIWLALFRKREIEVIACADYLVGPFGRVFDFGREI